MTQVYVSITGLRLRGFWHAPRFWRLAILAMSEAQSAQGNISAKARTIGGVHHTLTVWTDEKAMRAYLRMPHHQRAMKAFHGIATGRTIGFLTDSIPDWTEARAIWDRDGKTYGKRPAA